MGRFDEADQWADLLARRTGVGCAYCVTQDGHSPHMHCSGSRTAGGDDPVGPLTQFRIYSLTKLFTCFVTHRMLADGRLRMNDPVSKYLPAYSHLYTLDGETVVPTQTPLQIRHLLNMTCGIPYNGTGACAAGRRLEKALASLEVKHGKNGYTARQLADAIATSPLAFSPGGGWLYGYGHDVLGAVLESLCGCSLGEIFQKIIFTPLGLCDTTFFPEDESRLASIYRLMPDGTPVEDRVRAQEYQGNFQSGGGGLISTLADMALFTSALASNPEGNRLFRANTLTQEQLAQFPFQHFGYSWGARTLLDGDAEGCGGGKGEFGWYGVSGCWVAIDPNRRTSIVFLQQLLPCMERETFPLLRSLIWPCMEASHAYL